MRKRIIFLKLLFAGVPAALLAQPSAYLDSVKVWPPYPTSEDSIRLEVFHSTNSVSTGIYFNHQVQHDTILIEACYEFSLLPSHQYYRDTIDVNPLTDGLYMVLYIGHTSPTTPCSPMATTVDTLQFKVLPPAGISQLELNNHLSIYPNPATDAIHIRRKNGVTIAAVHIKDMQGRLLRTYGNAATLDISALPRGMYLLEMETGAGIVRRKFLKE